MSDAALTRLAEARSVLRDAWLEAGGCERCGGTGVLVEEESWPGKEALPQHPMLRRYPCDGEHGEAGIDPAMPYDEIAKRWRYKNESAERHRSLPLPMMFTAEGEAGQTVTTVSQPYVPFRGIKLVAIESDVGATSIVGWFIGAQNQMPIALNSSNGLSSRFFAPDVRDNEIDLDICQPSIPMAINIAFQRACRWEGTLFGLSPL